MTNAELIQAIRKEIERRITDNTFGAKLELIDILAWLDTLESETTYDTQKYTPRPSVSIEDVARVQFASHAKVFDKKRKAVFDWEQFKEVAGIFYGFGKKDRSDTLESEKTISPITIRDISMLPRYWKASRRASILMTIRRRKRPATILYPMRLHRRQTAVRPLWHGRRMVRTGTPYGMN